jgi:hypothetical protein
MDENYMNRIYNENNENDLFYNSNEVSKYEEQACCNNCIFSTFSNNNIFSYINDICFKDIPLDDEEEINNLNLNNQEVKTPFCSNKKKLLTPNDMIINNENNNNMINQNENQNLNLIRNSFVSNPSNDSAAEPIIPLRRNNTVVVNNNRNNANNNGTNIFKNLANIFKEFFKDNKNAEDDLSDKQSNYSKSSFKKRPILKRLLTNDEDNKNRISKNKLSDNNSQSDKNRNSYKGKKRQKVFDEILTLKIEENNEENLTELVSAIPAFIVKEKNKGKENNNKHCPICLGEFKVGEKESSLPCLHFFHSNCIEKWLKRSKFCPVCKLQISWESLNPEF